MFGKFGNLFPTHPPETRHILLSVVLIGIPNNKAQKSAATTTKALERVSELPDAAPFMKVRRSFHLSQLLSDLEKDLQTKIHRREHDGDLKMAVKK